MNDRLKSLYQTVILAKAKDEKYLGQLESFTHAVTAYNPLCGDKYELQLSIEKDTIAFIKYTGSGCSISKASATVLCESIVGTTLEEALMQIEEFLEIVNAESSLAAEEITDSEELLAFAAAREFPERKSCADLVWISLKSQLDKV